ncbi:MAG: hypothetical protein ABI091_19165 [Ferruginibacter sp.]
MERGFFSEIRFRLTSPWNAAFFGYFILIVIVFAGFGVGYSFFSTLKSEHSDWLGVAQNLATYFMAILASAVIDLNISWNIENRVSFLIYSILLFVLGVLILITTYSISSNWAFVPAVLGCFLAWLTWILANSDNEKLNDQNFYNAMRGKENHGRNWNNETL